MRVVFKNGDEHVGIFMDEKYDMRRPEGASVDDRQYSVSARLLTVQDIEMQVVARVDEAKGAR